jgi:hypothetical protein
MRRSGAEGGISMVNLTRTEMVNLQRWFTEHQVSCSIHGLVTISHASGGGIGTRTLVECSCGNEEDITDYSIW